MNNYLPTKLILKLQGLEGQTLEYLCEPQGWTGNFAVDLQVVTTLEIVDICLDVELLSFQGYEDEYSIFVSSDADPKKSMRGLKNGHAKFQLAGEQIRKIWVIEETVRHLENGKETWDYICDVAIVLELETGLIVVSKATHYSELLQVTYTNSSNIEDYPKTVGFPEGDLISNNSKEIRKITLQEAISR